MFLAQKDLKTYPLSQHPPPISLLNNKLKKGHNFLGELFPHYMYFPAKTTQVEIVQHNYHTWIYINMIQFSN